MNDRDLFGWLGVALAIGLLPGRERGCQDRDEPEGGRIAGLRAFAVAGLLGRALLKLALMSVVILPLLPDQGYAMVLLVGAAGLWFAVRGG